MAEITLEKIVETVTPLERKYDWRVEGDQEEGFTLIITDGNHEADGEVESIEGLDELVKKLETEVDGQDYTVIS